jgi:hypothetical protein
LHLLFILLSLARGIDDTLVKRFCEPLGEPWCCKHSPRLPRHTIERAELQTALYHAEELLLITTAPLKV